MELNELKPNEGSRCNRKRVGRGTSSGYGKTTGHGQKGQLARADDKTRLGFEGGQMSLFRRMPKRGFKNVNRREYVITGLNDLDRFDDGNEVIIDTLKLSGLAKKELAGARLLVNGGLRVKLAVKVNKVSEAAKRVIKIAGGAVEVT